MFPLFYAITVRLFASLGITMSRCSVNRACRRRNSFRRIGDRRCWFQWQCFRRRNVRALLSGIRNVVAGCVAALAGLGATISLAEVSEAERGIYARAVEHCRGNANRPMALDLDKRVLCFDGQIFF